MTALTNKDGLENGDMLRCVSNDEAPYLTVGQLYRLKNVCSFYRFVIRVEDLDGNEMKPIGSLMSPVLRFFEKVEGDEGLDAYEQVEKDDALVGVRFEDIGSFDKGVTLPPGRVITEVGVDVDKEEITVTSLPSEVVGKKADAGKAPVDAGFMQYFPRAIQRIAHISRYGIEKYDLNYEDKNFMDVPDAFQRYANAQARHALYRAIEGEFDLEAKELGYDCRHIEMEAWNAIAKLEIFLKELEDSDPDTSI